MPIKLGLSLPQMKQFNLARDLVPVARAAEETGYDSLWVFERTLYPTPMTQGLYNIPGLEWPDAYRSVADPLVTLAMAAAVTERVRLGSSVLVAPYHVPFQLARWFATLDVATDGRAIAGFGTGWSTDEYAAGSVAPIGRRGAVLDETLDIFAAVHGPDPVTHEGALSTIAPSEVGPKPARPVPVYLAASGGAALRRLVDRADGWLPVGMSAAQLTAAWQGVRELAAERGRTRPIDVCVRANVIRTPKPFEGEGRQPFQGSVKQIVEDVVAHAAIDGIGEILLDLCLTSRDAQELIDVSGEIHAAVRAAGV
ncbi:TIGR03619 family F420-dependent LLM class oxidoreductase [Streptomyces fuscigenes]|uniref:TIGR03619 family F420-dependent LLM class oxidoreductase n=1 Tax=Streptomyces fuscigenes TaxID=1528880 RepID=UPI001F37B6E1|nr:TIGR03619 family F420-dependent LLM class oxidoreductase [Streptomyces fuscigenes]MCF3964798.1 TIGR03619 family F420-dependent LLM class oxidoreductase [Streptomyces fuscigenes]